MNRMKGKKTEMFSRSPEFWGFFCLFFEKNVSFKISDGIIFSPIHASKSPRVRMDKNVGAKVSDNGTHWHSVKLMHCSNS